MSHKTNWIAICVFFIIATSFSAAFRFMAPAEEISLMTKMILYAVPLGWGPAIAALICWKVFGRQNRTSTWTGNWSPGAWLIFCVIPIVLGVWGVPIDGFNPHISGFILGGLITLYALGEEIGWRGYMHDALGPRRIWVRGLIISVPWYAWHLPFLGSPNVKTILIGLAIFTSVSVLFSKFVSENRSWLAMAGLHGIGNVGFMGSILPIDGKDRLYMAGVCLIFITIIQTIAKKRTKGLA